MRLFGIFVFVVAINLVGYSQNNFTIDEVVPGGKAYKKYQPQLLNFKFSENGKLLYLIEKGSVRLFDINTSVAGKVIFDLDGLNEALTSFGLNSMATLPDFHWYMSDEISFENDGKLIFVNYREKRVDQIISLGAKSDVDYATSGSYFSITEDNRLYIYKEKKLLYTLGDTINRDILFGTAPYRNEFGIKKGTLWSQSGGYLLFYKIDQSNIFKYPIVDYSKNPSSVSYVSYPMVGTANQIVSVGILELSSGKIKYINDGKFFDKYYTNITWSNDESSIFIAELDRAQQYLEVVRYDIDNPEKGTVLFSESESKYIEPEKGVIFSPKNSKEFFWLSRRDGYNHLYKYNTSGDILRQMTRGNWEITDILGFIEDGKCLVFESNKEGVLERHIYKLDVTKGTISLITKGAGFHSGVLSRNGMYLLDKYSSDQVPGMVELYTLSKGGGSRVLSSAFNPLKKGRLPKVNVVTLKAADDSTNLYARIVTPPEFDPKRKYPVILYVYGGPHSQLVTNKWLNAAPLWDLFMAQKGYIVFTLDNRGTSNRGKEFEQATYLHLGEVEMADQLRGIEYLKKLPYVDKNWIGVFGWSFGGFMAITLIENNPDVFKVGVAGGPVVDWSMYEIMYGERYMSTPQNNPEGYENANTLLRVKDISSKLLLIHGTSDDVVLWKQSLNFVDKCVKDGVQIDYFVYPNHSHNVQGGDRVHLMEKITEYFDDFLR